MASGYALLPRLAQPERFRAASVELRPGTELDPTALGDLLADAGFTREDPVDEHGEFSIRGGIVDWFPAGEVHPVRVEFIGETVESIRQFDPSTQRSITTLDRVAVVPLTERPGAETPWAPGGAATIFDYAAPRELAAMVAERDEVDAHALTTERELAASYEQAREQEPAAPAPEELFLRWSALTSRLAGAAALEQLAIDAPVEESPPGAGGSVLDVACQPAVEFRGRIQEWIAEVRRMRDRGDTVLFVAATDGRAERTVELLADYDLRGVLHRAHRRAAQRRHAHHRRRTLERLPAAARPSCRSSPRRTSSRRSASSRTSAATGSDRPRRRSCRISAISRSATSSSTWTTASASSSG